MERAVNPGGPAAMNVELAAAPLIKKHIINRELQA
jgi:hypothetical protein